MIQQYWIFRYTLLPRAGAAGTLVYLLTEVARGANLWYDEKKKQGGDG